MNNSTPSFNVTLRTFESKILYFNGMYKLPIAPYPTSYNVIKNERDKEFRINPGIGSMNAEFYLSKRLKDFKKILGDEIEEMNIIIDSVSNADSEINILTNLADLLGDIIVYCASEMVKYGIPIEETLSIIMSSNFSKLGSDMKPIYDNTGKVLKGPHYWKPEPQIQQMLLARRTDV